MLETPSAHNIPNPTIAFRNGQQHPPRRHSVRPWHLAGGVLLFMLLGLSLYAYWPVLAGSGGEQVGRPEMEAAESVSHVEVVVVGPVDFPLRAEATGNLAPWRYAEISTEAGGLVEERPLEEGQWVSAGELLLQLDTRDAQIELREAEADLLKARATYAVNTSPHDVGLPSDTTRLAQARNALQQAETAFKHSTISQNELQEVRRRFEAARMLSGEERTAVQAVMSGLAQAEQRVERAELALSRTQVRAAFGGRVSDIEVEVGQRMSAGQPVLTLLDDSQMKVEVDVLEADLVGIRTGVEAWVRIPALNDATVKGTIHAINPRIDPASGTGRVTVAIRNPRGRLMSGLFAYVEIETQRLTDRLVVPAAAVLVRQGRDLVFCIQKGRAQWVYVTVGARSGNEVEVKDGIHPGDTVAVAGHFTLAHDVPVKVSFAQQVEEQ